LLEHASGVLLRPVYCRRTRAPARFYTWKCDLAQRNYQRGKFIQSYKHCNVLLLCCRDSYRSFLRCRRNVGYLEQANVVFCHGVRYDFCEQSPWTNTGPHTNMSLQIAFLNAGLAAACATALGVNSTNNINTYGNSLGISASVGVGFLGLAWAAAASMLGSAVFAGAQCCAGRHYSGYYKASMRHMRVPRSWRHPGMRYHAMQPMGMHHPAMHPGMHPAMHTDMYAGMGYPSMMHPSMGHPSMMHPAGMHSYMGHPSMGHPSMGHPSMGHPSMGHPYMGYPYYG
jgi:hypothetical protein